MNTNANIRINYLTWLGWVLFFLVLFFKGCNPTPQIAEKIKVVTKEIKGETIIKTNIVHVPITKKVRDTSGVGFYVSQIDKLFEENNRMQLEFQQMDSLAQTQAYNKAIEINAFKQQFEDKYINAYVSGNVAGNVKEMRFKYTIKSRTTEVEAPKTRNHIYLGVNVANTLQLDKPLFSAELGLMNKKGDIIKASFDTDKRIYLGYSKKLF
jgi:hypothetical protein